MVYDDSHYKTYEWNFSLVLPMSIDQSNENQHSNHNQYTSKNTAYCNRYNGCPEREEKALVEYKHSNTIINIIDVCKGLST